MKLSKEIGVAIVTLLLLFSMAGTARAAYTQTDAEGSWTLADTITVVNGGTTVLVQQVSMRMQNIAFVCLLGGGQLPGGVDPTTNITALGMSFTNHGTISTTGTLTADLAFDIWGAWQLAANGAFSGITHLYEYGTMSISGLPEIAIDQRLDVAASGGFVNRGHFEADVTGTYSGTPINDCVITHHIVAEKPITGPMITANNVGVEVHLREGARVSVRGQLMNLNQYAGVPVDWWIVALAGSKWYYIDSSFQAVEFDGNLSNCGPVYQGPLFDLTPRELMRLDPAPGTYTIWLAVDSPMDGVLDPGGPFLADSVKIVVQ